MPSTKKELTQKASKMTWLQLYLHTAVDIHCDNNKHLIKCGIIDVNYHLYYSIHIEWESPAHALLSPDSVHYVICVCVVWDTLKYNYIQQRPSRTNES